MKFVLSTRGFVAAIILSVAVTAMVMDGVSAKTQPYVTRELVKQFANKKSTLFGRQRLEQALQSNPNPNNESNNMNKRDDEPASRGLRGLKGIATTMNSIPLDDLESFESFYASHEDSKDSDDLAMVGNSVPEGEVLAKGIPPPAVEELEDFAAYYVSSHEEDSGVPEVMTGDTVSSNETWASRDTDRVRGDTFYAAETLEFFRKGIDPELFEWVKPEEISPGATTCGFLKPELGSLAGETFPIIRVYVCMRFANIQPAAKGNIFVHCGGPGTMSSCITSYNKKLGDENIDKYNLLSIDQRGMGRSWPSFAHEACTEMVAVRDANSDIIDMKPPPELGSLGPNTSMNEYIPQSLEARKRTVLECWTCANCDFHLNATQEDGTVHHYHFLEFSGTRQLAEDIERLRVLINAPLLHLYGFSYGTTVFATYATMFPNKVGLFVLDSSVTPNPDHYHIAQTGAEGINQRIDYVLYSCRNMANPGSCPVDDMRKCIGDVNAVLRQDELRPGDSMANYILRGVIIILFDNDRAQEFCNMAATGNAEAVKEFYSELVPPIDDNSNGPSPKTGQGNDDPSSQPTEARAVVGNPDYRFLGITAPTQIVKSQDRAGLIYDEIRLTREYNDINELYTGAGTGAPGNFFFHEYRHGFYWPKAIPLPPPGNAVVTGIIAGTLYDSSTPYTWTQEMKRSFQNMHLLTSQSITHGLHNADDPSCQRHIIDYFVTGYPDFTDGQICGADFASEAALGQVFGLEQENEG